MEENNQTSSENQKTLVVYADTPVIKELQKWVIVFFTVIHPMYHEQESAPFHMKVFKGKAWSKFVKMHNLWTQNLKP